MKRLLCLLLAAALLLACASAAWAYTDTAELNTAEQQALEKMTDMNVISGYPDGSFLPANPVTRAEFAKMLCAFSGKEQANTAATFTDVLPGSWYAGWVACVAQLGWINGYPGNEYRPQAQITQQEIATVLVRLSGQDTAGFNWPQDYITAAEKAGFFKDIDFEATEPASRIAACQMLYNALPAEQDAKPQETAVLRGVITAIGDKTVTVMDAQGKSQVYDVAAGLLPQNLFPGAYLEVELADKQIIKVGQSFTAKKENAYWDIALDGKSATIGGKKYDIEDAEIFVVNYTLSKPFSADTFIKAGMIDRDILSLGGRLAAEAAVVLEESGSTLKRAYVVNASVMVSGGRLDVVEGSMSSAKGQGVAFLGRETNLPLADGVSTPPSDAFIHYNIKNGEISGWDTLYTANVNSLPDVSSILSGGNEDAPYAWVNAQGRPDTGVINVLVNGLPSIIDSSRSAVQLGESASSSSTYFLAEGCLVYEVKSGEISKGSKSSMEKGQLVVALVNRNGEICYMFCLMD